MLKVHDYTHQFFGHAIGSVISHSDRRTATLTGWGLGLAAGDFLVVGDETSEAVYQIGQIVYQPPVGKALAPWTAEVVFATFEFDHLIDQGVAYEKVPAVNPNAPLEVVTPYDMMKLPAAEVAGPFSPLPVAARLPSVAIIEVN